MQNPKFQYGVIGVGALALIIVIWTLFFNNAGTSAPVLPSAPGAPSGVGPTSGPGGEMDERPIGAGGAVPVPPPSPGGSYPAPGGAAPAPGAASAAPGAAETPRAQSAGVPTRGNPFQPNSEIKDILRSIPEIQKPNDPLPPQQELYAELNPPEPPVSIATDEGEGPPVPPMRVSGFVQGAQLSAIVQLGSGPGSRFEQAVPGKTLKYGQYSYKVERLEQDKVVLVNRWEQGNRKGVQRIEVTLAGSATPPPAQGMPGMPGMPGRPGGNYP